MPRRLDQLRRAVRMLGLYRSWPAAYRHRLARSSRGGQVVYRLRNGMALTVDAGQADIRVLNEVWLDRVYEPTPAFRPRAGWTVLDIGAHKGSFALLAAAAGAEVHAYEPSPTNLVQLRRNAQANGVQVHVHDCAVSTERGSTVLTAAGGESHRGTIVLERAHGEGVTVDTVTLDDAVETLDGRVELLKMDIEGAELGVLRAASPATLARVDRLVVECHSASVSSTDEVAAEVVELLERHGFDASYKRSRQLVHAERAT